MFAFRVAVHVVEILNSLIHRDVSLTNINREPCGG